MNGLESQYYEKRVESKLALGTAQFGLTYGIANKSGQISMESAAQILDLARYSGINVLDTAIAYGNSEYILGELGVQDFKIITKLPAFPKKISSIEAWIENQIYESLNRLRIQSLFGVLLHRSADLLDSNEYLVVRSLEKLKSDGLVQKIGVSIYHPNELVKISKVLKFDLVQAPLNLIDRGIETSGWLKYLRAQDIEIHTRSTFLQGLLLMPRNLMPINFRYWNEKWDLWYKKLAELQVNPISACLSYPISLPEVNKVVVGVDSLRHLQELINFINVKILPEDFSFMISQDEKLINPSKWKTS
jgi:aryl-alcohol dehydrogenase-like predicted oxidoreductase